MSAAPAITLPDGRAVAAPASASPQSPWRRAWRRFRSNWLGYVNSVNSHKPYGGPYMSGPYFGNAESNLYTTWQSS